MSRIHRDPESPSGYEADAERSTSPESSTPEEEEEESPVICGRASLEHITAKRSHTNANTTSSSGSRRRRRRGKSSSSSSGTTSSSFTQCNRVKRDTLELDYNSDDPSDDDTDTIFVGRTSCRPHGQYPKRQRIAVHHTWPEPASYRLLHLRRGGVVGGVASNLNDQKKKTPNKEVSLHLLSQIIATNNVAAARAAEVVSATSSSSASAPTSASSTTTSSGDTPTTLLPNKLSLIHCTISHQSCNIAEALSFSPRARLLLEAHAPHHVVHHNGAYESFLQGQRRWMPPELLGTVEYSDLTQAVQDLFVSQAVTLHPVHATNTTSVTSSSSSNDNNIAATHFLLELVPPPSAPSATANNNTASTNTDLPLGNLKKNSPSCSSASSLNSLPARAVG